MCGSTPLSSSFGIKSRVVRVKDKIMVENVEKIIGPYKKPKATFHPYDNRAPKAAGHLKKIIESYMS